MKPNRSVLSLSLCALGMGLLIIDSRTAAQSALQAVELCLKTLVPGLFPLFVLSAWMVPRLSALSLPWLSRSLGLPQGSEGIFLLGLVGGFPMGAACISQAVNTGTLEKTDAKRMLGICNNCGPAFLFGVLGTLFAKPGWTIALVVIQLEAAVLTGLLWPGASRGRCRTGVPPISLPQAVRRGTSSMVSVCAWVILANVAAGFLQRWVFPLLDTRLSVVLTGLMELTTGCLALPRLGSSPLCFVLGAGFVCFGGLGVLLQIRGLAAQAGIPTGVCAAQKAAQGLFGAAMAALTVQFGWWVLLLPVPLGVILKKAVEIPRPVVYNTSSKGGI